MRGALNYIQVVLDANLNLSLLEFVFLFFKSLDGEGKRAIFRDINQCNEIVIN